MQYHISQNGQQQGPFTEAEVRAKLARNEIAPTDLGWHEGLTDWTPIGVLLESKSARTPPPVSHGTEAGSTSGLAVASLVCGILGLATFITALPAVIMGHMALGRINHSDGALGGRG